MSFNNQMSIYIPRVFANISKERIAQIFNDLCIGKVKNIDFIPKHSSYHVDSEAQSNSAYIHFEQWYDTPSARALQNKIQSSTKEKPALLVYDDPWHWIVLENKAKKHVPGNRKICLDLSDDTSLPVLAPKKPMISEIACGLPEPYFHPQQVACGLPEQNDYMWISRSAYDELVEQNEVLREKIKDLIQENDVESFMLQEKMQLLEQNNCYLEAENEKLSIMLEN